MESLWANIPGADKWKWVQPIHKGWSEDKKFFVQHESGQKLLLRIQDVRLFEGEKLLYKTLTNLSSHSARIARLVDSGVCTGGDQAYHLFTWLEGVEAKDILLNLSPLEQFQLGVQSGKLLQEIHALPIQRHLPDWSDFFNSKIDRNLKRYRSCGIRVPHMESLIEYVESHRYLLSSRPQSFNHGDYHVGNMLINSEGDLGIIDFNRLDVGDPWVEYDRISWCASLSPYFASGRIRGYFAGPIPDNFFPLMALYIASNQLGGIYWIQRFDPQGIADQVARTEEILSWYRNFTRVIPTWYQEDPPTSYTPIQ